MATVALIDCRWVGHHPTYFQEMCQAWLESGYRVHAICPDPAELKAALADRFAGEPAVLDRIRFGQFRDPRSLIDIERLENDPISVRRRWKEAARCVRSAERRSGWRADLIFFAWLDSFLRSGMSAGTPNLLGRPWSGLYFFNHHLLGRLHPIRQFFKGDHLLRNFGCRAVGVLDERSAGVIETRYGVKSICFPDITNEEYATQPMGLGKEIREKARGRFTIGLVSLEIRKGFLPLLKAARESADRGWYFAFSGPFQESWFDRSDLAMIRQVKADIDRGEIDHIHLDLDGQRVSDGPDYNGFVEACDVLSMIYHGWQGSSNALTKAAVFEKWLLSWEGGCIGPRTREFEMGVTTAGRNSSEIIAALENLERGIDAEGRRLSPRFSDYRRLHSRENLRRCLNEVFLRSIPTAAQPAR